MCYKSVYWGTMADKLTDGPSNLSVLVDKKGITKIMMQSFSVTQHNVENN